ncbi:MAG: YcbK family protein [Mesorhizobium sp.]|nr:YcbK family protein [Mesorhizobium sp.]
MRVAGAAFLSLLLVSCTTGGLASLEVGNPAFTTPEASGTQAANADGTAAAPIVSLAAEQDADTLAAQDFVPVPKPGSAAVAVETAAPTEQTAAAPPAAEAAPQLLAAAAPATAPAETADVTRAPEPPVEKTASAPAPTQFIENRPAGQIVEASFAPPPKKRGFLAGLFSASPQEAPVMSAPSARKPQPVVKLASAGPIGVTPASESPARESLGTALPGVRQSSLFEITRKSGLDDDSDVDLHEDEEAPMQLASAAGMGRLAPNGLLIQRESVDVACLKPSLVRMLKQIEQHYGKRVVITSGYRSPTYNKRVRGARNSMHMYCAAVDLQIAGVSKWELANYARSMPARGGVGTYCHTESVHIDVGPERDWNWRCRRRKS